MPDFSALPALAIKQWNVLDAKRDASDYQTEQTLRPLKIQAAEDASALRHTAFGNSMLAQAADEASTLGPDAPAAWDSKMEELAKTDPRARQYIGRYTPELGKQVKSAFGGDDAGGSKTKAAAADNPQRQQMIQQIAQVPQQQRAQSLASANAIIDSYNKVNSADELEAEAAALAKSNPQIAQALAGIDFSKKDKLSFYSNYQRVSQLVDKLKEKRDMLQEVATNEALGFSNDAPANKGVVVAPGGAVVDPVSGKELYRAPPKDQYEYLSPDKTGGGPGRFNKGTGQAEPLTGPDNFTEAADKITATEKGATPDAKNPLSSATGDGQFVNKTWLSQARKQIPALKNVPDDQLLDARKFPGLAHDMTVAQVKEDAAGLENAGQPVTMATSAMAYKLGLPDALKVLKAADPNTPLDKILSPAVMKANPDLKGQTAGTYAKGMADKFGTDPVGQKPLFGEGSNEMNELQAANPAATEILGQTGLGVPAFMLLTGTGSQLARDKATRAGATKVANEFAKQRGVDISTFKSQYKAYNETLEKNISRYNNTKVMEDELLQTIQNLKPAASDATIGNVNAANAAAIWAGKQTNGPVSQEYAFYLGQLREELSGYNAALAGRNQSEISDNDYKHAESVILNGLNERGIGGIEKALMNSTAKMGPVMERSIDRSRQNVWDLFGVGKNYKPVYPNSQPKPDNKYDVGQVVNGFKFKGGNWRDKNSWVKQ